MSLPVVEYRVAPEGVCCCNSSSAFSSSSEKLAPSASAELCESHVERECSTGSFVESPLDRQLSLYRVSLAELIPSRSTLKNAQDGKAEYKDT